MLPTLDERLKQRAVRMSDSVRCPSREPIEAASPDLLDATQRRGYSGYAFFKPGFRTREPRVDDVSARMLIAGADRAMQLGAE